VSQNPNLV